MTYQQPQCTVLGPATRLIEVMGQPKISGTLDGDNFHSPNPAYDLDE
jgi:hypothetical protein